MLFMVQSRSGFSRLMKVDARGTLRTEDASEGAGLANHVPCGDSGIGVRWICGTGGGDDDIGGSMTSVTSTGASPYKIQW